METDISEAEAAIKPKMGKFPLRGQHQHLEVSWKISFAGAISVGRTVGKGY